ncbi:hypothetical protein BDW72DRAFT_211204 [Aspergillus terricola var. indicus]
MVSPPSVMCDKGPPGHYGWTSSINHSPASHGPLTVAIVGGGIIGIITALGLVHRGLKVTIYERAPEIHESGAAMAFTGLARHCMRRLDQSVLDALSKVSEVNRHPYNRYWDGFHPATKEAAQDENAVMFQVSARELSYCGCLRSHLLRELSSKLPERVLQFNKELYNYIDDLENDKVVLEFTDGTRAEADAPVAVIGCDGIHSRVRQLLLGETNPAARAEFSHKVAYRTVVPIAGGIEALGDDKANNQCAHLGPDANTVSYPVANWTLLNVSVFLHDPNPWSDPEKMTAPAKREEVSSRLKNWSPSIQALVDLFPEDITKWAIFDTADHPAATYAQGRVCIIGDAAHASAPFHGAGACMGVEDALALATALASALRYHPDPSPSKTATAVEAALQAYSDVRLKRSQWLVKSSREMGDIYSWRYPETGNDGAKIKAEFEQRSRNLWDYDIDGMLSNVESACLRTLSEQQ